MDERPIILIGGGTGGHIFPLVAVAEELAARKVNFLYVGSRGSLEEKIISSYGWPFAIIEAGKWRRYLSLPSVTNNIIDIGRVIRGFFQSIKLLRRTRAKLVFSKGGYVAMPLLYAARVTGCPVIIHESDSIMGVANRVGSKFSKKVLTAFDTENFANADGRYVKVGIPVRKNLRQAAKLQSPKKIRPVVLVLPGSQGSAAINQYLKQALNNILEFCDVVHLTGNKDFSTFESLRKQLPKNRAERYRPYKFIDRELPYYYQSADLVVARSSATTAAEAALFSKALYVVPLPDSANNHQQRNASLLEKAGAAVVRQQYQLSAEVFASDIKELLSDRSKLQQMGSKLAGYFGSQDATTKVIKEINETSSS